MNKSASHIILFAAFLVLAFGSCASRKKLVVHEQPMEWLTAHLDIEAEANGTRYPNLSGQLRMRRDSVMWTSISMLGMEVMRLKVTTDSVWLINRMDKTYLAEPLEMVAYALDLPITFATVQEAILGNAHGYPPSENQVIELKRDELKGLSAKVKYSSIRLDEPTTFPCKITSSMERLYFMKRREQQP